MNVGDDDMLLLNYLSCPDFCLNVVLVCCCLDVHEHTVSLPCFACHEVCILINDDFACNAMLLF
jgi:hypothetical protein